jgi:hypothetical protein
MQMQVNFTFDNGAELAEFMRAVGPVLASFQASATPRAIAAATERGSAAEYAAADYIPGVKNKDGDAADISHMTEASAETAKKRGRKSNAEKAAEAAAQQLPLAAPTEPASAVAPVAAPTPAPEAATPPAPAATAEAKPLPPAPANHDEFRPKVADFMKLAGVEAWSAVLKKHGYKNVTEISAPRDGEEAGAAAQRIAAVWPDMCAKAREVVAAKEAAKLAK